MVEKKKLSEYKKRYNAVRHHAWAGSVLLAILLAARIFIDSSDIAIENIDIIILILGAIIIVYTMTALFLSYKYRSGLTADGEKEIQIISSTEDLEKEKIKAEVEKERLKLDKKKVKAEAKKEKKIKDEKRL